MSTSRVIRKYPNRRLYDTEESRYITLDDVRQLVIEERPFVVIDKKSERDITRSVLLQVISELEKDAESVLSQQFLAQVIRCQGHTTPVTLASRLEDTLRRYLAELKGFSSADKINPLTSGPQMP
jgi:polyhydroxyalkanoate synthesis repressor PhaR